MPHFSLHAIGRDRPGIVAAVAACLAGIGCNLEESRMTILRGQFAVMLVLEAASPDGGVIERALEPIAEELNLFVAVRPLPDPVDVEPARASLRVTVSGADHAGIVARIANEVAACEANIVELVSRVVGEGSRASYVMELDLDLTDPARVADLGRALSQAAADLGVTCTVLDAARA